MFSSRKKAKGLNCHVLIFSRTGIISSKTPSTLTPNKLERGGIALKKHQMFFGHTTSKKFENETVNGHFEIVLEENSGISYDYRDVIVFENLSFQNVFCLH